MNPSGHHLRKAFRSDVAQRSQRNSVIAGAGLVIVHAGSGVVAALTSYAAFGLSYLISVPAFFIVALFIGTRFRAISNMMHECSHYAFVENRQANNVFGKLLSIPLLTSFDGFRATHFSHHQHTGHSELDLDFVGYEKFRFDEPITRKVFFRHLLVTLTLRHVPSFVGKTFFVKSDPSICNVIRLTYVIGVAGTIALDPLASASVALIGYLIVPYFTTFQIVNYWTDVLDHAGLFNNDDELRRTRNSVVGNPVLRSIFFPRSDCFHLVHHLFPQLPTAFLPEIHARLMEAPSYAALDHSLASRLSSLQHQSEPIELDHTGE